MSKYLNSKKALLKRKCNKIKTMHNIYYNSRSSTNHVWQHLSPPQATVPNRLERWKILQPGPEAKDLASID